MNSGHLLTQGWGSAVDPQSFSTKRRNTVNGRLYEVTSEQAIEHHLRSAEKYEKDAEEMQTKLERVPEDVRDECQIGNVESYSRYAEQQRKLAAGVVGGRVFLVNENDYLNIVDKEVE